SFSLIEKIAFVAPRILNDPVLWKFSHLRKSCAPAILPRDADFSTGVRWMRGAIRAWAATMASHEGSEKTGVSTVGTELMARHYRIRAGWPAGGSRRFSGYRGSRVGNEKRKLRGWFADD